MRARKSESASGSTGGGILAMISSRMSLIPMPALAEAWTISVQSRPMVSSISSATRSGSVWKFLG